MLAASARTSFPCASLGLKLLLLGRAQASGEKRSSMKRSKPGSAGGEEEVPGGGVRSGPPQVVIMRVTTVKARRALGKSEMSLARSSMVVMMVSNPAWFSAGC